MSILSQSSALGPVLLNIFINDLDHRAECTFSKFVDDTKVRGMDGSPESCAAIQRDPGRLES